MDLQIAKYHYPIHLEKRCQGDLTVWNKTYSPTMSLSRKWEIEKRWEDGVTSIPVGEVRRLARGAPLEISVEQYYSEMVAATIILDEWRGKT